MCKWLIITTALTEDLRVLCVAKRQLRHGQRGENLSFSFSSSPTVWEQTSPCRCRWAELQLSLGLWRVQEDGAEGGEDLPGSGSGQLALCLHQPHAVSFPQRQDQAEGRWAPAWALPMGGAFALPGGTLQSLDAAVGHGQDGLHPLALLCCQQPRNQVTSIQRDSEDAWQTIRAMDD